MTFNINQIVKGKVAGEFIILGFRNIGGEDYVQVKPYSVALGKTGRGELSLPLTAIKA
jgi:hypothetical protein